MAASWLQRTGLVVLLGLASVATVSAATPGSELTRRTDKEDTFTSPDGQVSIEQYWKNKDENFRVYQFWAFDAKHQHGVLLNRDEDDDLAGYPAGFRFSPNSQWVVRMQKIGSGTQTLFLYRRNGFQFSSATPKPLAEMAWDYFFSQPVSRKMHRKSGDRDQLDHNQVNLLQGVDDNYASMGSIGPTAAISCSACRSTRRVKTSRYPGSKTGVSSSTRRPTSSRFPLTSSSTTPGRSSTPPRSGSRRRQIRLFPA